VCRALGDWVARRRGTPSGSHTALQPAE
jgi:hypothetical protein